MSDKLVGPDTLLYQQGRLLHGMETVYDTADRAKEAGVNNALTANIMDHRMLCLKVGILSRRGGLGAPEAVVRLLKHSCTRPN